jgi:hypothetical protein
MMMDELNGLLQLIADEHFESLAEIQHDEMVAEFSAEFEMLEYAARSYDNDAVAYGELV